VAKGGAILTNYSLPVTASGSATITKAPLTMTADNASTYLGIAPTLTYRLTGLIGGDTAANSISSPTITYTASLLNAAMTTPLAGALVPSASSSNYAITTVSGSLMVVGNSQMLIRAGSNTATYGVINSGNVTYVGDALSSSTTIIAGYCTNCAEGVNNPTIINLTLTAPVAGSNVWTATDALGSGLNGSGAGQGQYTFIISPTIPANSYSAGNNLNVGNYDLTPSNLLTVTGFATNYDTAKPIIYTAGTISITPKTLTVLAGSTTVASKTYDGTNVATLTGGALDGVVAGDTAAVISLTQSGTFASVNKASGIAVTSTSALAGTGAANYVLTQPTGLTGNITAASVTIGGLSVADKVYDANTSAVITGTPVVLGLIGSDTALASGSITASFAQSDVGENLTVTPSFADLSLDNANYAISGASSTLVANITVAPITVSAAKTYDGTNSVAAGQMTVTGVAGQTLTFDAGTTGTLSSPNVGSASLSSLVNAQLVNGTGLASNYTVINPSFSTVTITPAQITVGLNSISKVYDTTPDTASALTAPVLQLVSGTLFTNQATGSLDSLSGGTFVYADVNAGANNKTVNVSNASIISGSTTVTSNYSIAYQANTTSTITPAPLLIGGLTASNKVYNNNTDAAITGTAVIASGLLGSDTANLTGSATVGSFAGADVGTGITVTPTLNLTSSNSNYYVAGLVSSLNANITQAPVTISGLTAANRIYDATTDVVLSGTPTIDGLLVNTSSTVSGGYSGVFASANVGTRVVNADLSNLALSNSNYYIAGVTEPISATIAAAPLTVGGLTASSKVYDTNQVASLTGTPVITAGLLGSDVATLTGTATVGTFASPDVGTAITVTATLSSLGSSNSNYYIAGYATALAADITQAPLTISGLTASNKTYDTTTSVTLTGTPTLTGLLNNQSATISGSISGAFVVADAGTNIAVSVNLGGLSLSNSNYYIAGLTAPLAANITAAPLTVTANNQTMVYGSPTPTLTYTFTGLLGNDSSGFTGALATDASSTANVGNGYSITQGTLTPSSNYRIAVFNDATMTIMPRPVDVTVTPGQYKVYGNSDPSSFAATIQAQGNNVGLITGSTLSGSLARVAGENTGIYRVSEGTLVSANPNYLVNVIGADFIITARSITVTAAPNQSKIYGNPDGVLAYTVTTGSLASFNGVTDVLVGALGRAPGNNVGFSYAINAGGLTSAANPNYDITFVSADFQTTARPVALNAPEITKVYDGGYTYSLNAAELAIMNEQLVGFDKFNTVTAVFSGSNPNVGNDKPIEIDLASVSISDGNLGRNYQVSSVTSLGNITPASLIVTAANDAKFRTEVNDAAGYAGALYTGFVNGESVSNLPSANRTLQIARSDSTNNAEGTYTLTPSGHGTQGSTVGNYQVSYVNGIYRILGPQDLLIRVSSVASYGSAPSYQYTAKYLDSQSNVISYVGASGVSANPINLSTNATPNFALNDGSGGTLSASFMPLATTLSASDNVNVGQYNVSFAPNPTKTGFVNLTVVGSLVVEPKVITVPTLSATSISKAYDGNTSISSNAVNLEAINSQIIGNDDVRLSTVGFYDNKNVGTAKDVTLNFAINGAGIANYALSSTQVSGAYGAITQLASVTYIGPVGGNWSDPNNWAGGAIPDLSNVANVLIPVGSSVSYDSAVAGPVTSQVAADGALSLASAGGPVSLGGITGAGSIDMGSSNLSLTAATGNFSGAISGTAGLTIQAGSQTLSGVNTYTGPTAIDTGASLTISGAGVLGNGSYAGSVTNNGSFSYASTATQTMTGDILGTGDVTKTNTGTLILGGNNSYTGATTVSGGTLAITNASALGSSSAGTTVNTGGTLDLRNVTGVAEPITVVGGTLATSTGTSSVTAPISISGATTIDVDGTELTLSGIVSGSGSLEKEGAGTLVLSAANTYSGATTVDAGTLAITDVAALGTTTGATTVNTGGTLDLRNVTDVAEPITLAGGTLAVSTGSSSVTSPLAISGSSGIDVDGTQLTLTNVISGSGSLDKTGTGTLLLEAANTYTGATTVSGGTLAITNVAALGTTSGATTVNTGGTLDLRNVTGVAEPITLAGGTLAVSTGSSSVTSPLSISGSSAIDIDGTQLTLTNVVSGTGSLDKTGTGTLLLEAANTYTGATSIDAGSLILAAGASISGSERVTVGANGIFDTSAITDNVYIKSLAGAGDVINGSTAPNSLVITNGIPGDVFSGVISGSGGLRISGGTQTLTGANTYSGPTVVDAGANLIAAIQSIPGDIVNNGSFGFNQATAGTFAQDMSGSGVMAISGSGLITLTGTNTQAGGTRLDPGASVMIGSVDALSGNTINSNNGSFGIASNIVLSSLDITGSVTLTTDISTTGPQSYNNIRLAPSSDNVTTLETVNSDITITGTIDGTVSKMQSIVVNAGTGKVTLGDSIGSIAMPNTLTITGSEVYILADILTGDKQEYNGAIFIGSGSYIGKAFVRGFLFDSHSQYFEYAQSGASSTISYLNNDPRYVRTLVSKDPVVTFNGTVNDVTDFTHTLLVAAIAADATSALVSATMPIVNFNDSVSQSIPLYSLNVQTIAALANTNTPDLSVYVGIINIAGDIATFSNQTFRTASIPALSGSQPISFSVYDPMASIAFRLPPDASTVVSNPNIVINGQTNLGNFASGFTQNAALGYTINLPASAYGDLPFIANSLFPDFNFEINGLPLNTPQSTNRVPSFDLANKLANGGSIRGLADYQMELVKMSTNMKSLSGVSVSTPSDVEVQSDKPGARKSNAPKRAATEICMTDANGTTECEEI
jgi:autotransporter-associated beta strand protein